MPVTSLPRSVLTLAALAAASLALAAVGSALSHRGPTFVAHGTTARGERVALAVARGRVTQFAFAGTEVHCQYGWSFAGPGVRGAVHAEGDRFVGSGSWRRPYPDGSTAMVAHASVRGTAAGGLEGTLAYAMTFYNEGAVTNRCTAGMTRFTAR